MLCDVQWLQGSYCTVYCTAGGAASFTSSLQKLSLCGLSHPHIAQSMIPWCPRLCLVAESITWAAMEVCQHQPFSPECKQTNKANRICSTCQKRAPSIDEKSIKIQAVGQSTLCRSSCLSHRNTVLKKTAFLLKVAGGAATQNTIWHLFSGEEENPTWDWGWQHDCFLITFIEDHWSLPMYVSSIKDQSILQMW